MKKTSEAAFETAIEAVLLNDGYRKLVSGAFNTERAIFPDEASNFIRETQSKIWQKLEVLHGFIPATTPISKPFFAPLRLRLQIKTKEPRP